MIRLLICDDEVEFLKSLSEEINSIFTQMNRNVEIHSFQSWDDISDMLFSTCDIAVLDVDYEGKTYNGMDIARKLRTYRKDAIIIFVTNFIEYAPEGYEVQAFRYLLKSNLKEYLCKYIRQAVEQVDMLQETIKIQINGEVIDISLEHVLYFEVLQHNITVYLQKSLLSKDIKTYSYYGSLSDLEQKLEPRGFLRIHKSYLVNMRHLRKYQCREALLDNGMTLRVGEKSYAENKKKYLRWKGYQ